MRMFAKGALAAIRRLMRAVPVPTTAMAAFTVKTPRKGRRHGLHIEVNRQDHNISVLIALEPCSLIPIAIEPSAHHDHLIGEVSCVQPDLDRSHGPSAAFSGHFCVENG